MYVVSALCLHSEKVNIATIRLLKNLALYIRDCVSVCLSDETLKAVGPFYLVYMPVEVKYPTSPHWNV